MNTLIVASPADMAAAARHLAMHLAVTAGFTPDRIAQAFTNPFWIAADETVHTIMAMPVSDGFLAAAAFDQPVPAYDPGVGIDSAAAETARQTLAIWFAPTDASPSGPVPLARADQIIALVGMPFDDAAPAMGLTAITQEY